MLIAESEYLVTPLDDEAYSFGYYGILLTPYGIWGRMVAPKVQYGLFHHEIFSSSDVDVVNFFTTSASTSIQRKIYHFCTHSCFYIKILTAFASISTYSKSAASTTSASASTLT